MPTKGQRLNPLGAVNRRLAAPPAKDPWCLTIAQPMAWLIAMGLRPYERRGWRTHFRGRFWVHASAVHYPDLFEEMEDELGVKIDDDHPLLVPSSVLGSVELYDCVPDPESPGVFLFLLRKARPFKAPVSANGMQKFWHPRPALRKLLPPAP